MKINHAILHVFDFVACENTYAREELDITNKTAKNYVTRLVRKALGSLDNKRGAFSAESHFARELDAYFRGESDFVDLSVQIGEFLSRELGHMEKPVSTDLLVVDFEDDAAARIAPVKAASKAASGSPEDYDDDECPFDEDPALAHDEGQNDEETAPSFGDELDSGFDGPIPRYFALFLLESKQAYVHELMYGEVGERNDIARHHAVLPNPSQKLTSYAVVDLRTLAVLFVDKERSIAGEQRWLIPDGLLQCSMEASSREAFTAVTELVEAVAEEYGHNTTVALSRAKAYAVESAQEADDLDLDEIAEAAFQNDPVMKERFEEAAQSVDLPERVPMAREAVRRVAKSHKIRTDTGIEVTFPAEYSRNPEYITFTSEADGTISIQLKNIGHIENR